MIISVGPEIQLIYVLLSEETVANEIFVNQNIIDNEIAINNIFVFIFVLNILNFILNKY